MKSRPGLKSPFVRVTLASPMVQPPFCIIAAPRSRTAWFSRYLSHGGTRCEHDPSRFFRELDDIGRYFKPGIAEPATGATETLLGLRWRDLQAAGVRLTAIIRPKNEVIESGRRMGYPCEGPLFDRIFVELDQLPADIPRYRFADLDNKACAEIFERCLGYAPPPGWTEMWASQKVECDLNELRRDVVANFAGIKNFYSGFW